MEQQHDNIIQQPETPKRVKVFNKDGGQLSNCTRKVARRLIYRQCAKPIGYDRIQLTVDDTDRKQLRQYVFERDNYRCYICGETVEPDKATIDHIISKAKGGPDSLENWACCCWKCNNDKGDLSLEEYQAHRKGR